MLKSILSAEWYVGGGPVGAAHDAASDTALVGGRDQSSIFVMDPSTGGLMNSWLANDGSSNPKGLGVSASGSVWQTSGNSSLLTEFDLGGPAGPTLTLTGACPGLVTFAVNGADINGDVSFSANIPSGACGLSVQAVDLGACEASNAAVL